MDTTTTSQAITSLPWPKPRLTSDGKVWFITEPSGNWDVAAIEILKARSPEEAEANAAFIVRACNTHEKLLDACRAALSQLTEDREEYLADDIRQLQAAIDDAKTGVNPEDLPF